MLLCQIFVYVRRRLLTAYHSPGCWRCSLNGHLEYTLSETCGGCKIAEAGRGGGGGGGQRVVLKVYILGPNLGAHTGKSLTEQSSIRVIIFNFELL